jgi:ribonuclease P protein component
MLPRKERLTDSEEFGQVFRRGRGVGGPLMLLKALKVRDDRVRVGVSVSRKLGKAVARNRAKRLLREAARRYVGAIRPGYDVVLVAKEGLASASFQEIVGSLGSLLFQARLLCSRRSPAESSSG